nr:unnamed protein product [Digitaria exilis]
MRPHRKYVVGNNIGHAAQLGHPVEHHVQGLFCSLCFAEALKEVVEGGLIAAQACSEELPKEGQC